ncbi:MAG: type II/III secretion system protein [Legionella sp.]|nr:type II/III secretion system protein [Legionella sp.]
MRILMASLLLWAGAAFADSDPSSMITKVIELHYVKASDLIPQLTPLLLPSEVMSGSGSSLIVRVSPTTLTQLRQVIHQLDVPPVVFTISIHQGSGDWLNQQQSEEVYSATSNVEGGNNQSVNVMSGASAFVSTATERPILSSVSNFGFAPFEEPQANQEGNNQQQGNNHPGNNQPAFNQQQGSVSFEQKKEVQGFYIKPVMQGGKVKLTVRRIRQQANRTNDQASEGQSLTTTTIVPLNKWVKLGDTRQGNNGEQPDSVSYGATNSFTNEASIYIRINVVKQ